MSHGENIRLVRITLYTGMC